MKHPTNISHRGLDEVKSPAPNAWWGILCYLNKEIEGLKIGKDGAGEILHTLAGIEFTMI